MTESLEFRIILATGSNGSFDVGARCGGLRRVLDVQKSDVGVQQLPFDAERRIAALVDGWVGGSGEDLAVYDVDVLVFLVGDWRRGSRGWTALGDTLAIDGD